MNCQDIQYLEDGKIGSRHTDVNLFMQHNSSHTCAGTHAHTHAYIYTDIRAHSESGSDESLGVFINRE